MLLGLVWTSRTALEALREGTKTTLIFRLLFFPILADFGSKMGVKKPCFLGSLDGSQAQKLGHSSEQVHDTHFGRILDPCSPQEPLTGLSKNIQNFH